MSELVDALELEQAREVISHAKACLAYANAEGVFSYRKRTGLLRVLCGPPMPSRLYYDAMYHPSMAPSSSLIEWAERKIAEHKEKQEFRK